APLSLDARPRRAAPAPRKANGQSPIPTPRPKVAKAAASPPYLRPRSLTRPPHGSVRHAGLHIRLGRQPARAVTGNAMRPTTPTAPNRRARARRYACSRCSVSSGGARADQVIRLCSRLGRIRSGVNSPGLGGPAKLYGFRGSLAGCRERRGDRVAGEGDV